MTKNLDSLANGPHNIKRRTLPFDPNNKQDVRGIGTSRKR
tara:strand:- start:41 stop:160 length:120 start_codon:yes stop_codon:yes gene_type:complete